MVRANWGPNWGLGLVNTNWGPGPVNKNWGPGSGKHKDPAFLLLLIICFCYTVNYNTQWAFVIQAWHYSHNNRIGKNSLNAIFIKKFLTESNHFCYFDVFPVQPPQKIQVQAKISTILPVFPDYLSVSCEYDIIFCIIKLHHSNGKTWVVRFAI